MVRKLVDMMLHGGTGLSNGVGIVIEIIRKNNSDYDFVPVLYITIESHPPTPRDPIYLGTLVKVFSEALPKFTKMLERKENKVLETPFGQIEPLGFERFKICELIAELLHCSNMALLNDEKGEEIVRERDEVRESLIQEHKKLLNQSYLQNLNEDDSEITDDNINQIDDHDNDDENNENENENNENSEITNNNETENSKDNNNNNNNTESLENENIDEELSNKVSDLKLKDNDENNENKKIQLLEIY
ncbi:unnamed protein product [[Candida] boidinii]|nr:unnamed protein product [[Candida] boidinii]